MNKYKISNKQWISSMIFYFLIFFIGSLIILSINRWLTLYFLLFSILISILLTFLFVFIMTQVNYISALEVDEEFIYIWKRNFFRVSKKKYSLAESKFKYKKNYYGNLGKPYCLIIEVKYDRKEIIPEPVIGKKIMAEIITDIEKQGTLVEIH